MTPLFFIFIVIAFVYFTFGWVLPHALAWLVKRRYKIHLRIGRIFFPYLTLRNVIIAKNGFTIEIEDIAVRSSLFSSDVVKLLAVVMRNVKINKNVPVNPGENGNDDDDDSLAETVSLPLDFRNTKIPSIIITFVQFMAVHIDDVNLHALGNGWLVNGSAESLNLDGSVVHGARTLLTSIAVTGGVMKLHRNSSDSCLSQIHFAGTIEATLRAQGELTFENLSVKIGSSSVIVGQEDTTIPCLEGAMKNFQVNARLHPDEFQINLTIKLEALSLRGKMPVLSLRSLSIDSRIKDEILKIKSQLNSLYLTYDHSDWEKLLLLGKRDDKSASKNLTPSKSRYLNLSWLNEIKTTTDLLDGSLIVRLPDVQEASCGIARISVSLNRKHLYEKWTKKLTIESLRCTLNGSDSVIPETAHHWGNPISVGVLIATTHPNAVGIVMDLLRVEWNLDLAKFLEKSFEYYNENWKRIFLLSRENDNLIINKQKLDNDLNKTYNQLNLKISNCNLFLIASNEMSIMLRIDSSNMENIEKRFVIVGEGICAITLNRNEPIMCEHAKSIKRPFLTIRKCKCAIKNQLLNINIDESGIVWSPNLHLRILQLWDESLNFRKFIKLNKINNNNINQKYNYDIYATSDMTITIDIDNQKHFLQLSTDELHLSENEWKLNYLRCSLNNADIITIEGFKFIKLNDSIDVRLERKNNEDFILDWNETWELNIDSAKACFPYEHKFAEAIQNKLLSIRKWLKEIHSSKDSPKNNSERLYCDLVIKIREWIFEVSDDPFEVRLRDIYQLLEDEYKESLKRQSMLTAKVKELCRTHLLLPQGKVEELYASLNKKNAETYVKRWRQMQRSGPRTRLFAWIMQDIEIIAVADPTITGIKNATKAIAKIDSESLWPDDGIDFSILWVRGISMKIAEWKLQLRDFPQPLLLVEGLSIWGRLGGAEALAPKRAKRTVIIQVGDPWSDIIVERGMTSLKYYHDLNWDIDKFRYAFGPCWEPVIAQCNLSFEKILHPSRDPSPPLPFWDKMRLALHGRLTLCVKQLTVLLHASLDPYNTTEEMELTWSNLELDWTLGKIIIKGDLDVYVRTASKYDDCRLLHLPNVRLSIKLNWICLGDSRDHHAAIPCAPDRLPEYSSNQEHDSFRAFRSQNINVSLSMETKPNGTPTNSGQAPTAVLYGSTLRWFENLKFILSGATRPTRKGRLFNNIRPRKKQLSRHYKNVRLTLAFHKFHVSYWMSFSMQRGFEITCGRVACSSEHNLSLNPINDGLIHRHRASWSIIYMNCELNDAEIWLKSALQDDDEEKITSSLRQPVEKCYFLSVTLVSYGRDELICIGGIQGGDTPTHRLVVHDLKGAWTKTNRDVAFALFDSFIKTQQLKKNLSTAALKGFHLPDKVQNSNQQQKIRRSMDLQNSTNSNDVSPSTSSSPSSSASTAAAAAVTNNEDVKKKSSSSSATTVTTAGTTTATTTSSSSSTATTTTTTVTSSSASSSSSTTTATKSDTDATGKSATSKIYQTEGAEMLQRLIAEAPNKPVVFSDDLSVQTRGHQLRGLAACNQDDLLHTNWHIALVNSQVLLKGIETKGYVILSAAKAEIFQRVHRPVWREQRTLVSKTTWLGSLECMQYYATVSANIDDNIDDNNIMWLSLDNIQEKDSTIISGLPDVPALVGSGQSVGGVVSQTVGGGGGLQHQLQRIVSRCKCEFFYACYGQTIDSIELDKVPAPPREEVIPWERKDLSAADAFTLMHHDLDVCTNSLQYTMLLDVVNNLLLYVEPRRKEANEKLQRMRFQLQLQSIDDQKKPIQQLQNTVRGLVAKLRRLERETYLIEKALAEELINHELHSEMKLLEKRVYDCKELLCAKAEELDVMLNCYKETIATTQQPATLKDRQATLTRAAEICFKHAQWRLTDADGLLGIADLILTNFLYTKTSKTDDSVEHLLELGYVRMMNLLPNQIYTEVLTPTELQSNMPVDRQRALRVFCREKAPVAGISVKEHFEINVVPLTIGLTKKFFNTMLKFCFPERDPDGIEEPPAPQQRDSSFYVQIERRDDIEKMKERADKNKLFIYIKIPEVPVRVSYKGNKDKNIEDVRDFALVIPTLEYHNVTWTWLDLLLAMKSDSRRVILSQAIKQKLQIKPRNTQEETTPQEEDKARLLLGARHLPGDARKKSVFKFK